MTYLKEDALVFFCCVTNKINLTAQNKKSVTSPFLCVWHVFTGFSVQGLISLRSRYWMALSSSGGSTREITTSSLFRFISLVVSSQVLAKCLLPSLQQTFVKYCSCCFVHLASQRKLSTLRWLM